MKTEGVEDDATSTGPPPTAATDSLLPDAIVTATSTSSGFAAWDKGAEASAMHAFITQGKGELVADDTHTPRTKGLLAEAEVRAEHQAIARITMLDLAKALEEAAKVRRDLEVQLHEERRLFEQMRSERSLMQGDLDQALEREERVCLRRMRELIPRHEGLWYGATWWSTHVWPLSVMAPEASTSGPRPEPTKGDWFVAREWFRAWREAAMATKSGQMDQKGPVAKELQDKWEEERKKMEEEFQRRLAEEKKNSACLQAELDAVLQQMQLLQLKLQQADEAYAKLKKEAEEQAARHQEQIKKLENELSEARNSIAEKERLLDQAEQALVDADDRYKKMEEKLDREKKALQTELKKIQGELAETCSALRLMKEHAVRSKRDAAGGVSPEKYAQLIADLEEMRDRINALMRESEYERENASWLRSKLDQSRRRLELERQFLPLLRKVRGPVGPKNAVLKSKNADAWGGVLVGPPPVSPDKRLSHSQSAGFIDAARANASSGRRTPC